MAQPTAPTDRDLTSISEARTLVRRAREAAPALAELSQEQIDAIVDAMAAAVTPQAEALARLAHEETGYGNVPDKVQKNLFSSQKIYNFIRPMKTVGVVGRLDDRKVIEIAEPFGVVAAIVPSTNPTSTAIYKILIAIKARCPIVISPHPSAARCITRVAEIMHEAARRAGAPDGSINWMTTVTLEGTQELMKARETAVILATGGMGLVRAAYSAGKPAYGVGPGNAPAYIEATADVAEGRQGHRHRQDVRQRAAVLVRELGRLRRRPRGGSKAPVRRQRRPLSVGRGNRRAWTPARHARNGCPTRSWSGARLRSSRSRPGSESRLAPVCSSPNCPASAATTLSRLRSSAPSSRSTSSRTGGRGASAANRSSGTAGWATRCRSTPGMTTSFCSSG